MQEEILTKDEFLYALKRALSGEVSPEVFNENIGKGGYTIFAEMVKEKYGIDFQGKEKGKDRA